MFAVKLLANLVNASNYYIAWNMFEHVFTFDISQTMFMFNSNESKLLNFKN